MSQTKRKFLEDNAVGGTKFRLDNNEMLRARNAANSADVNIAKLTSANKWEYQVLPEVSSALAVPSTAKQLATVEYIQNYVNGKGDPKDSVSLLALTNVPLSGSTPLVIDGVTVTDQMRVGLVSQTDPTESGIYVVTVTGPTYTAARSSDATSDYQVTEGMFFVTTQGTLAGYEALLTTPDPIVVGTTALTFVTYPTTIALVAGDMLARSGNTWTVDLASLGGLESTNPGNAAGQLRVKVDTASLEQDQTTRRDPSTGAVMAKKSVKELFTLNATDITNQYVDLTNVASYQSINFEVAGAPTQYETVDYTVNYTGGVSSKTRITFAGGLASAGVSALASGDNVIVSYMSF